VTVEPSVSRQQAPVPARPARSVAMRRLLLLLRFAIPAAALTYILSKIPLGEVWASMRLVRPSAVAMAVAVIFLSTALATYRWRLLFRACGIDARPPFLELFRVYWICLFYNTYLPGGVGGEVVRGLATRRAVGERGLPAALAIVLLERTLGFTGMVILVAVTFTLFPLQGIPDVMLWSTLGLGAALASVVGIVSGPRLARYLPKPLGRIAAALPSISSPPLFAVALLISVVTQFSGVVAGHLVISSISAVPSFTDSMVILPLVNALQYFPLTVGGTGVREAGFVVLYPLVGVSHADALAASLVLGAILYGVNAMGGVLHALRPIEQVESSPESERPPP
jgi:glycosyltransferase 2 family protein